MAVAWVLYIERDGGPHGEYMALFSKDGKPVVFREHKQAELEQRRHPLSVIAAVTTENSKEERKKCLDKQVFHRD